MKKKINLGDVFVVNTQTKKVLLHYVHYNEALGYLMKVFVLVKSTDVSHPEHILNKQEDFMVFFFIKQAIKSGDAEFLLNIPVPNNFKPPRYMRDEGIIPHPVLKWRIVELGVTRQEVVAELTDEQASCSPFQIWYALGLIENIDNGFSLQTWR